MRETINSSKEAAVSLLGRRNAGVLPERDLIDPAIVAHHAFLDDVA
jgi:hypothetical protein